MTRHGSVRLAWSCLCGVIVALAIWLVSRGGALLTPDSLSYIGAAHSLAEHGTLRVPVAKWTDRDSTTVLRQFPPGYPVVLAVALRAGVRADHVVRGVNALAAFFLVALCVWLCSAASGDSWTIRITAPLLILSVRALPSAWASAWSEPLFLVAVVATLVLMARRNTRSWMYGVTAALGNMVRYAGVSLLLAVAVWAAWQSYAAAGTATAQTSPSAGSRRRRMAMATREALLAAAPGVAFNLWWLWRAKRYGVATPVATVAWMGNLPAAGAEAVQTISAQLVPLATVVPGWVRIDIAALVFVTLATVIFASIRTVWRGSTAAADSPNTGSHLAIPNDDSAHGHSTGTAPTGGGPNSANLQREWPRDHSVRAILAAITIAASYTAMLAYSRLFVGGSIPLDDRLLAPLVLTTGVAALLAMHAWLRRAAARTRVAAVAGGACWLAAAGWQSYADVASLLDDRDDYGSDYWTDTPAAEWLRTVGSRYALFSNDPVATYFITGRPSRMVPAAFGAATAPDFVMRLRATNGVLIGFPLPLEDMVDARELARQAGLCMVVTSEVGTVWRLPASAMDRCADGADDVPSAPSAPAAQPR